MADFGQQPILPYGIMLHNWKRFNIVFWSLQGLLILFLSHFLLWHGEPEGYFEIFSVPGFVKQFIIHVMVLLMLAILIDRLHTREFLISEKPLRTPSRYRYYSLKFLLLPVILAIGFAYFCFKWFGGNWNIVTYIERIFPVFLLILVFINMIALTRHLMMKLVRKQSFHRHYTKLLTEDICRKLEAIDLEKEWRRKSVQKIPVFYKRTLIHIDAEDIVYARIENHSVKIYLPDGKKARYDGSLSRLIELIDADSRFYATGNWVINGHYVDKVENTYSRAKLIHLRIPFKERFSLSKERVSEFMRWLEENDFNWE